MPTPSRRDLANAVRFLAIDAVEAAKSGHPGMPMGMADIAEVLWNDVLQHNPNNPKWFNRDRFVLSNGHGSMLQYALLHLSGYDLPIEELKHFRQLGSKTPGHPENFVTGGVETTTGPLGQGFANAVGFALAEKLLAQRFNRPEYAVVDHRTWVFLGDGCLMEGISHEAASLAGTWGLNKLVAFWDDNGISIDGKVEGWFTDDTPARFEAYGWNVIRGVDGHDAAAIKAAIDAAMQEQARPTLVCCRTTIGFGSPGKAGKESSHGAPLGKDEVAATREALGWPHAPFEIPEEIRAGWRAGNAGLVREEQWNQLFDRYAVQYPQLAEELVRRSRGELPDGFIDAADAYIAKLQADGPTVASRKASQMAIEAFAPLLPELVGGSADLAHSNLTLWKGSKSVAGDDADANYVYYGVREFAMTAISNGLALHGCFIPYDATFLVFSDYARNAVRMSALMGAHAIHVYTHDSIGLGEDGPTHQPVEHLAALRHIPGNDVWRPCDAVESSAAWKAAIARRDGPSCLVFSRQNLAHQARTDAQLRDIARGGYVLRDSAGAPELILVATGSEVGLAMQAAEQLGDKVRVVSMPSTDVFDRQDGAYRESVLPDACRRRVAIEAGITDFWRKYVGLDGAVIG
ncbi:MAG TPA: transketolase, partial [Xanthomonadaceae bacterium]|nr:transketolase [Xanthomonadaceae bacterium]